VQLVDAGVGAPGVERVEALADLVTVRAGAGQGEQVAQLFFGDPGGQDLRGRVGVDQRVPHRRERLRREAFLRGE
jgi:hypothetical protein